MIQATYDELRELKPTNTPEARSKGARFNIYCMARYGTVMERPKGHGPTTFLDAAWAAGIDDRREAKQSG